MVETTTATMRDSRRPRLPAYLLTAIAYTLAGKAGLHFAVVHPSATAIWPPTGIAIAALLLGGVRLWPAVFVGAFVVNITTTGSVPVCLGIAAGNTLEALAGAMLVARYAGGRDAFAEPRTIFGFAMLAGFVAPALSATIGVTSLVLGGFAPPASAGSVWLTWWLGDAAGALVIAPLLIVWSGPPRAPALASRRAELVASLLVVLVVSGAVFLGTTGVPLAFLCLPPLVWAAYRVGARGATLALTAVAATTAAGTVGGRGPFALDDANDALLVLQAFLVTVSATVLPLAALAEELAHRARRYRESEGQRLTAEAFARTSRDLAQSLDVREVAQRIVVSVRALLGGTTAIVYRLDAATGAHVALAVDGDAGTAFTGAFTIPAGEGTIGLALREGRPVVTPDLTADSRIVLSEEVRARLTSAPHRAALAVPLVADGRRIGALLIGDRAGRVFTDNEAVLAEAFAHHAALAIRNARLFADAEAASRAKDQFLAVLSHELRTPLNAIVGWTRMLRTGVIAAPAVAKAIEVIDRNATVQVQLIEDLLDVSRIVSGQLRIEARPVALVPVLAAALDAVRPTAERKGVRLLWNTEAAMGLVVVADAGRLQQVVWNLLINAVKFTPADGTVSVATTATLDHVTLTVTDTGVGIDPEELPHVFEQFRQADSSTTRQHGGLGLGLALVKHIVELHGGSASATSAGRGNGARFSITLPRGSASDAERAAAPPRGRPSPSDLSGVSVVIVDDEPDARALCGSLLARYGATVETAASVREAVERIRALKPDVVVADLGMPDEDGFDLIRRLRADESDRGRRTVVVALSAFASEQDRQRALAAGFDTHVAKPFDPDDLAATIETLLRPPSSS